MRSDGRKAPDQSSYSAANVPDIRRKSDTGPLFGLFTKNFEEPPARVNFPSDSRSERRRRQALHWYSSWPRLRTGAALTGPPGAGTLSATGLAFHRTSLDRGD